MGFNRLTLCIIGRKNPITMSKDEFQQYIRMVKEEHAYFSTKVICYLLDDPISSGLNNNLMYCNMTRLESFLDRRVSLQSLGHSIHLIRLRLCCRS